MKRAMTMKNVFDIKHKTFDFDGVWLATIGNPTKNGFWLIYGPEKNFKTSFALMLADYLRQHERTLYVSAEEGVDVDFINACERMGLDSKSKNLLLLEYEKLEDLSIRLQKKNAPRIVFLDNATIYKDELANGGLVKFAKENPQVLFILIAHEERGLPYTAPAMLCRKLAKRIFQVKGGIVEVSGRCEGGKIIVNKDKATLYHGSEIIETN